MQGWPPAALPHQPRWVLLPSTTFPPAPLIPAHGHRSPSTCSAGKTFPAHEAELASPGQPDKAPRGARPCSALCCFSFPFPEINRPPQRETNAFVSKAGRTVRMACLPASRQGLDKSPRAMGSPATQHKSLLTVLLLRRSSFWEGWGFCPPACFSPGKSRLMPACPGRLPSPTAFILNRHQLDARQGVCREAPVFGPLHVPLGWQAPNGVPKLSSKEVAFSWGCPAPSSGRSSPTSAPSSGP